MSGLIEDMRETVTAIVGCPRMASEVVRAILKTYGGGSIYLPAHDYRERNEQIRALMLGGASAAAVARRFQVSIKTVYRIVAAKN